MPLSGRFHLRRSSGALLLHGAAVPLGLSSCSILIFACRSRTASPTACAWRSVWRRRPRSSSMRWWRRRYASRTTAGVGARRSGTRRQSWRPSPSTSHPLCIFHLSAGILGTCHHLDISLAHIEWRPALVWRRSAKSAATRTELLLNFIFRLQVRSGARRVPRRALHQEHPVLRKIRWVRAAAGRLCEARPLLRSAAALLEADP